MSKFSRFMRGNKTKIEKNVCYAPTKSLCDENGKPLEWEFKHITTKENEALRDECTIDVQVPGKPGLFRSKFQSGKYITKLIAASVVTPDLLDAELQDSYGVKSREDLLLAMVDHPGEYTELAAFVQQLNGMDGSFNDKVKDAKN